MNCKNCGAPIHGYKCDYCGTEYEELQIVPAYRVDTYHHEVDILACSMQVPLEYSKYMSKDDMANLVKRDMASRMCDKIVNYMDIETWIDPQTLTQHFGGRIKVAKPC